MENIRPNSLQKHTPVYPNKPKYSPERKLEKGKNIKIKDRTLVKTKIVLNQNGTGLVTYFWKKTFWIFGYWYPFGCCSCSDKIPESMINKVNDDNVSKVLYDEFIIGF